MKKIIIFICLLLLLCKINAQMPITWQPNINFTWTPENFNYTAPATPTWYFSTMVIGSDTLQWLKTHLEQQSTYFNGKAFSVVLDSLYQLQLMIKEYDPPLNIQQCPSNYNNDKTNYHLVDSLTMYFEEVVGTIKEDIHMTVSNNNFLNQQNNTVNTHIKYFTVVFANPVHYPKSLADSKNGWIVWTPFAPFYWGHNIVQSVHVGEY